MDGLTMRRLANEMHAVLLKSKIEKIYQPGDRDLVLTLRTPGQPAMRLLLSAHKQFARMHFLQDERPENPKEPPMYCMLLRKHIEGGRIVSIRQRDWDRVIDIRIEALDEVGDVRTYSLLCELMGRHSNLILCREEEDGRLRVIDAIVRVNEYMSRHREVLPGSTYHAPPAQSKQHIKALDPSDFIGFDGANIMSRANVMTLVDIVAGLGPVSAREIMHRVQARHKDIQAALLPTAVYEATHSLFQVVEEATEPPTIAMDHLGRATECAPFLLTHKKEYAHCPSMSEAIRRRFADTGQVLYHTRLHDELVGTVEDALDKLRGKQVKLEQSLASSNDEAIYRMKAELLTAFAHQVEKGESRCVLPNYYEDNQPIAIDLDPSLDAIGNAQRYFKQASKRKRAASVVQEQLTLTKMDISYLEDVLQSLVDASLEQLELVRKELAGQGFLQVKQSKSTKRKPAPKNEKLDNRAELYISTDGFQIRVGRNNLQNERLTFRQSEPDDLWFHVKDQPGSHVVIRKGDATEIPEETVEEAALLAAYFSRGRDSANVPVDYTQIRHVWRPNGARPGFALYDHQHTLFVTPDRQVLEPLLQTRQTGQATS